MQIIATFDYDKKTYVFYVEGNDYRILCGFLDWNGNIVKLLNSNEIKMMKIISKQIFISKDPKNHLELSRIRYKSKIFTIMYDKISKMRFFYENTVNNYKLPILEDTEFLMKKFNTILLATEEEKLYKKSGIEKKPFFERIAKYAGKAIVVTFLSLMIFSAVDAKVTDTYGYEGEFKYTQTTTGTMILYEMDDAENFEVPEPEITKSTTEFSAQKIIDTIDANEKLSPEEKELMKSYLDILTKYKKYVDMDYLLNVLANLDFRYHEEKNGNVAGNFDRAAIIINLFHSKSFEDPVHAVKKHEGYHGVSMEDANCSDVLLNAFEEGVTEVLTQESCMGTKDYYETYYRQTTYIRMLCEILGDDPIMGSYITGDKKYVVDALCGIIPDEEKALKLLSALDVDMICSNTYVGERKIDLSNYNHTVFQNAKEDIFYGMNDYFMAKFGYPMTLDAIMMLYYRDVCDVNDKIFVKIAGDTYDETYFENSPIKGYFVNSFISKYPEAVITATHVDTPRVEPTTYYNPETGRTTITQEIKDSIYSYEDIVINEGNRKFLPLPIWGNHYILDPNSESKQKG